MTGIVHHVEQRSEPWHQLRCGRLCGSKAYDAMKTVKSGGWSTTRQNLRIELALERITNEPETRGYVSQAMQDGIDRESDARALYEAVSGQFVESIGFVSHPTLMAGGSPDGLIGAVDAPEGIVEIKSPLKATHFEYIKSGRVPEEYAVQVQHNLWLTGAQWADFVSFHPAFPEAMRLKTVRVHRHDPTIDAYEVAVRLFMKEVQREIDAVSAYMPEVA